MPAESYPRYSRRFSPCRSSGLEARLPTYPMIPHIREPPSPSRKQQSPAEWTPSPPRDGSAELSSDERRDASTGLLCRSRVFCLCEDANQGLRARRAPQDAPAPAPFPVQTLDLRHDGGRQLLVGDPDVLLRLRPPRHDGGEPAERAATERAAEQQPRGKSVARHVVAQEDDVTGLLAAEYRAVLLQRFEHVAVAD